MSPTHTASPNCLSKLDPGDRVLRVGRFGRGFRNRLDEWLHARGAVFESQVSAETAWVLVGAAGWPLRRDGRLPRDLLIAEALRMQTGRPAILPEFEVVAEVDGTRVADATRVAGSHPGHVGMEPALTLVAARRQRDLARLLAAGVPVTRLRRALGQLSRWFPNIAAGEWSLRERSGVVAFRAGRGWMTADGQRLLDFDLDGAAIAGGEEPGAETGSVSVPFVIPCPGQGGAGESRDPFTLAVALERAGEFLGAEDVYRRLLLDEGPDPDVCFNLANVLVATGRHTAALERLWQAVELRPRFVEAWHNLGLLARHQGDFVVARKCLVEAVRLAPDFGAAVQALATVPLAENVESGAVWP